MRSGKALLIGLLIGLSVALAVPSIGQTSGQFSQLVGYVGKLAARLLVAEQKAESERIRNNAIAAYVREFTCKHNSLAATIQSVSKATDAVPVTVEIVTGKNCAGDGPALTLPADLQ